MDCIIYIRWSSAVQAQGSSLVRQRDDCRRHAERHGWNVVDELIDDGVSAYSGAHVKVGALAKFISAANMGQWSSGITLLMERLDRLSRQGFDDTYELIKQLGKAGVTIATVDGDRLYRPNAAPGMTEVMEILIKASLAHEESEKKAARLASAWKAKRDRLSAGESLVMTSRAPAWLRVEGVGGDRRFVVVPERGEVVKRIFEDTARGIGKATIARDLNREGVPTFGRAEGWHPSYVQKILNNPSVLGEMQPGSKPRSGKRQLTGDPIPGYYPAVVDAGLHARATASMAGRARRSTGRGRSLVNLLSGIAKCRECGSAMTFRGKGLKQRASGAWVREDYLICDSYQRGKGCTNGTHFNYVALEARVLDSALSVAMRDDHFAAPAEVIALEQAIAERARDRDGKRTRAATAMTLHLESGRPEPKAAWLDLSAAADADDDLIEELRGKLIVARGAVPPAQHAKRVRELRGQLEAVDEDDRFAARTRVMGALHELVETITCGTKEGRPHVEMIARHDLGNQGKAQRLRWVVSAPR